MNNDNSTRHPNLIAGALREQIERLMRVDGHRYGYDRLKELVDELDQSLLEQQLKNSISHLEVMNSGRFGDRPLFHKTGEAEQ